MTVTKKEQPSPPLAELASIIERSLRLDFDNATAEVVQCPDLPQPPFGLAARGLSGHQSIADIGGTSSMFPKPNTEA